MFRADIPPHISEVIRHLSPDLRRSIKAAVRALCVNPSEGAPLVQELEGLWKYRVSRFRIVYAIDRKRKVIRVMAVGHRRSVYEKVTEFVKRKEVSE
ncbi:MAG: type II toxin-antitoxin system RelE/ParE family toxin [Nitrospirota bacterium]|nr:type II toxin-antitoxin system RelE/ParE family toxin [Nitrospirota bacterium]